MDFEEGQRIFLKSANLPILEASRTLRPRSVELLAIIKTVVENAGTPDTAVSPLACLVCRVSLLLPEEEEPPHLTRAQAVKGLVAGIEYVVKAILGHRSSQARRRPGSTFQVLWLEGLTTWEPGEHSANRQEIVPRYVTSQVDRRRGAAHNFSQSYTLDAQ